MKIVNEFVEKTRYAFTRLGEYTLEAIYKEIIKRHDVKLANTTSYNADGCHTSTVAGKCIELSVVEVVSVRQAKQDLQKIILMYLRIIQWYTQSYTQI